MDEEGNRKREREINSKNLKSQIINIFKNSCNRLEGKSIYKISKDNWSKGGKVTKD